MLFCQNVCSNTLIFSNGIEGLNQNFKYPGKTNPHAENLFIEGELFSDGLPICISYPVHLKTYKNWETLITFPIKFCELPVDTVIGLTIYDMIGPDDKEIIGGTTIRLFKKKGFVRTGKHQLKLYYNMKADGSTPCQTYGKLGKGNIYGDIEKISINPLSTNWLDKLTLKRISELKQHREFEDKQVFLNIQLPIFELPILHKNYDNRSFTQDSGFWLVQKHPLANDVMIQDDESHQMNPAEEKYTLISMNVSSNQQDLYPTATEVKKLMTIINQPSLYEMSADEQRMVWKFRYYLKSHKKALVPFLRMIHWEMNEKQEKEATKLLQEWSEPNVEDALILISKIFAKVDVVRKYGVNILKKADDETILDILLELIQAIRYEDLDKDCELSQFLIKRACKNFAIANNMKWYLTVESLGSKQADLYSSILKQLFMSLKKSKENDDNIDKLKRQDILVQTFNMVSKELKNNKDRREVKIVELKKILSSHKAPYNWSGILNSPLINVKNESSPLPLPLDFNRPMTSILSNETTIFKSAKNPMMITFKDTESLKYKIIWKHGDDLRQDQLVLQMIHLMNKLLLKNGLDLKLTPYAALATSLDSGMLECVDQSTALSTIIANGDIKKFLEEKNKDPKQFETAMDNFIKSCAGYCVVSFLLGIGDRHLDNILMKDDGKMFHIDFGYILGHDPKPFPPPVKLCKEMIIAMGGSESKGYQRFKEFCCTAYNILRKSTHLILNLFILMVDANIPNLMSDTFDPFKNVMKIQEKFKLELSEEEAVVYFQSILAESEKALFPQITETFHRWAQYWRS